jgi:hypothetical protein
MEDKTMVSRDYTAMYSGLLKSPWACSLEDEQKVRKRALVTTCVQCRYEPGHYFLPVALYFIRSS